MKKHTSRRNHGFTLVELLVVIAIIAVLAGAGFAAGNAAVQKAKRVKCLATCTSLEAAVSNFYSEYNYPPKTITTDTVVSTDGDNEFLNALLGYTESAATPLNLRAVKFLAVREGKNKKDGLIITGSGSSTSADGLYDPWGGPYKVMLDGDYDEVLKPQVSATDATTSTLNGRKSVVWSNGADGVAGGGKVVDDVITWAK